MALEQEGAVTFVLEHRRDGVLGALGQQVALHRTGAMADQLEIDVMVAWHQKQPIPWQGLVRLRQ